MAHLYRLTAFLCFLYPSLCFPQSAPVGVIDLAGWVKNADGTYTKAIGESARVTLTSPPSGVSTTSTALVSTSKGVHNFEITKTAIADTARIGASLAPMLKKVGPLGVAVSTATLVCELTTICEDAGNWLFNESVTEVTSLTCASVGSGTVTYKSGGYYHKYKLIPKMQCGGVVPSGWGVAASCSPSIFGCAWGDDMIKENAASATTQAVAPHAPTDADWEAAKPKLNDTRFIPEILDKSWDLPTSGIPSLTPNQKKGLGLESTPTKDASGNIIGREDTMTEIEAVDGATADSPGRVIIKETKTTVKYDNNNNQISTSTTTNYTNQTSLETQPNNYEIKFDTVEPFELPTYNVPNTYSSNSWGSGTCPPDITVATSIITFAIPSQPVCDTAVMINPFVLLISTILGIYIISGVRGGTQSS